MWEKLLELGQPLNMPWIILGDFNCVKSPVEKQLGVPLLGFHCTAHFNPPGCLSDHSPDHPDFIPTIERQWRLNVEGTPQFRLCRKLKSLKSSLKAFNNLHYSHISVRAKEADLALQDAQTHLESNPGDGDRNTKFFHDMVKRNAARNSILAITKADGSIITSAPEIAQEFVNFYTSLLGQFTPAEVKTAVFQISDNKAPGPDGYTSCFFKKAWNIVGDLVCSAVMDFFRSGRMLRQLNHTIIALVPKSEHSPSVADYRPISCCNVIYKVITKIIADRLSPALMQLVDSSQAAFVGGRNITDNIFLAQEMVRQYSRKRISPRCTINVDLRKAFDSVSWTFLSRVLHGPSIYPHFDGVPPRVQGRLWPRRNNAKSNIFTAGIQNDTLDEALAMTDFARGHMPVRYLGIPLAAQRLSVTDYSPLSLRRSIVCAGPSYGILSVHRWHGRIFAIQRRKAVWVFGISNPGTLLSLPESYGTFIARQTPYGSSGSMRFTFGGPHFGTGSRRRTILHYFDDLPRSGTELSRLRFYRSSNPTYDRVDRQEGLVTSIAYEYFRPKLPKQPWKALFGRHSYRPNTHSFYGLEYGRGWQHETDLHSYMRTQPAPCALIVRNRPNIFSLNALQLLCLVAYPTVVWHHPTNVNPSQCSKVAQEREDWLLCAEQSAASRFGMHGL
ncbi:UNVERIFIED_CONTAM: hypothetical protein Sangu_1424000 [Sesamum angustifolium]|uniref:Reverse transcriptase domain-containing protein n=1 Tax=Sesamum angustifolium TaxID=2727405 RepID=A0AAW2N602_9LAMI